jgi:mannose-6-phosphate isomerase
MVDAQLLTNAVRHYAWGSRTVLPHLLGLPVPAVEPWAEIWIGAHPTDPSLLPDGRSLAEVEPHLPYLVKLLAADVPLSIQAHPSRTQARSGYAREEAAGVPVSAAERTYKDANHKPELLVALQPTEALCGFRAPAEILDLARRVGSPGFSRLVEPLGSGAASREAFTWLVQLTGEPLVALLADVASALPGSDTAEAAWVARLVELHPGDPGVLAPLLLRLVELAPGDALFVGAGVLHAYLHGAGVEVQASSDNVLRGGLTRKPVDIPALLELMSDDDGPAPLVHPSAVAPGLDRYEVPVDDFSVWRVRPAGAEVTVPARGPRIAVCVEGTVVVCDATLRPGEAVYLPSDVVDVVATGTGTAFVTA